RRPDVGGRRPTAKEGGGRIPDEDSSLRRYGDSTHRQKRGITSSPNPGSHVYHHASREVSQGHASHVMGGPVT
ncbi:hypothetical protein LINPERPRIM_LOCUS24975, partial [Linum perenne]